MQSENPVQHPGSRYERVGLLGAGNFGKAWLVKSTRSGRSYVIKEMKMTPDLSPQERDRTFNEVNIIKSCWHINIIKYKEFFVSSSGGAEVPTICIVMEYAAAGDLHQCIRRYREVKRAHIPEVMVRNWLVQIAFALQYLHRNSILHRDLKTRNIFMTSNRLLKLGDFGISRTLSHEKDFATTGIGTPQYLSPEIYRQQKYDYKTDIWGLGCVLYEICALQPAFPGNDWAVLFNNILKANYKPIPKIYSEVISELVKVMLRPDPSRRPTAAQITSAKVLQKDAMEYLTYAQTLPEWQSSSSSSSSSSNNSGELHDVYDPRKVSSTSCSSASADDDSQELAREKMAALASDECGDFPALLFGHPPPGSIS